MSGPTNAQLREKVKDLEGKLESAIAGRNKAQSECQNLQLRIAEVEAKAREARATNSDLAQALEAKQDEVDQARGLVTEATARYEAVHDVLLAISQGSRFSDHPKAARAALGDSG